MEATPLAKSLGGGVRAQREQVGLSQEDLARAARQWGLPWRRSAVAAIETGARLLALDEMLVLTAILGCPAADLLTGREVGITDSATLPVADVRRMLSADFALDEVGQRQRMELIRVGLADIAGPGAQEFYDTFTQDAERNYLDDAKRRVWPRATKTQVFEALQASRGDAEVKAARRLGVDSIDVALAAVRRWGHSLTREREVRIGSDERAGLDARALQARRGVVTRALVEEIRPLVQSEGAQQ